MRLPSSSAWPRPHSIPPISWLRASSGLSTRPGANTPASRRARTSPSSGSTATSANWAPNVSSPCGVSSGGGVQLPVASASEMVAPQRLAVRLADVGRSRSAIRPSCTFTDRSLGAVQR